MNSTSSAPFSSGAPFGASVTVKDETGDQAVYKLMDAAEADAAKGVISVTSPLGQSLLGQGVGATVKVPVGKAGYKLTILKISRD